MLATARMLPALPMHRTLNEVGEEPARCRVIDVKSSGSGRDQGQLCAEQ